jgi:hypothetical protein
MTQEITKRESTEEILSAVLMHGDLSKLSNEQRLDFYFKVCESVGLNPLTQPLDFLKTQNGVKLYVNRGGTAQLREKHRVSTRIMAREKQGDLYVVTAKAFRPDGREEESTGAVTIKNLQGEALANAVMKAETKAKRRATLDLCGLGWIEESEAESIPGATRVQFDVQSGAATAGQALGGEISPFVDGEVIRSEDEADALELAITEADSMDALRKIGTLTPSELESYSKGDQKRISKAFQRRKRQLESAGNDGADPLTGEL